eukprot:584239-Rhodomonas_salina.4
MRVEEMRDAWNASCCGDGSAGKEAAADVEPGTEGLGGWRERGGEGERERGREGELDSAGIDLSGAQDHSLRQCQPACQ